MSLEQAIADLQTQAGLLLDLPQAIADAADAQIVRVGNTFNSLAAEYVKAVRIHKDTGLDTNPGTFAAPVKTLARAVEMTPPGGICFAYLMSDVQLPLGGINASNRHLIILSDDGTRYKLTAERGSRVVSTVTYRECGQIIFGRFPLVIDGLEVVLPVTDGGYGGMTLSGLYASMFRFSGQDTRPTLRASITNTNINRPANTFGSMFHSAAFFDLNVSSVTINGLAMEGYWLSSHTNTSGVAAPSTIRTNLSLI